MVDDGLRERILSELHPRRMVGIELEVTAPRVLWLSAKVSLVAERGWREQRSLLDITERAREILQSFFDPYLGGPDGTGWPFGRDVHLAEVIPLLQRLKGVEAVDSCVLRSSLGPRDRQEDVAAGYVKLKADMLVCSLQHEILFHRGGA